MNEINRLIALARNCHQRVVAALSAIDHAETAIAAGIEDPTVLILHTDTCIRETRRIARLRSDARQADQRLTEALSAGATSTPIISMLKKLGKAPWARK